MAETELAQMLLGFGIISFWIIFYGLMLYLPIYIYTSVAWMFIAQKLKYDKFWLAFIPFARYALLPILAKKREKAWPWVFILLIPIVGFVFMIIWKWKIFERRKYPGGLSLIQLGLIVPFFNIFFGAAYLVLIGLVAWLDQKK